MFSLLLSISFSFRLDPEIIDIHRSSPFAESFTILDGDKIKLDAFGKDVFVAVQPHFFLGNVYSTCTRNGISSVSKQNHSVGERFHVSDCEFTIGYEGRGGSKIVIYMMPHGLCDGAYAIYTSNQRKVIINLNKDFGSNLQNICWLMNYPDPVDFDIEIHADSPRSEVVLGDQKTLATGQYFHFNNNAKYHAGLNRTNFISLKAIGKVHMTATINSDSILVDWTDKPSFITERGNNIPKSLPSYLEVERNIPIWVWSILFSIIFLVFMISVCIFFGCCQDDKQSVDLKKKID